MTQIMNQNLFESASTLRDRFANAEPFPHLVIDNFLTDGFARKLLDEFPRFDSHLAKDEHGRVGKKCTREDVDNLGDGYRALSQLFSSEPFLRWMSELTEIKDLIHDPMYIGGGTHENLPGQDLSLHVDFNYHPFEGWHRRLNVLLYLNPEWDDSWGGALELWRNPWDSPSKNQVVKIAPRWNRMVVFATTENSWHGFEAVKVPEGRIDSRKSFALYLYSKERPAHERRSMHSTIYYERPIPETIKPGEVLSAADYEEMMRLTVRRDEMLRLLYERESELHRLTEVLTAAWETQQAKLTRLRDELERQKQS
jgi:hypothetical protein